MWVKYVLKHVSRNKFVFAGPSLRHVATPRLATLFESKRAARQYLTPSQASHYILLPVFLTLAEDRHSVIGKALEIVGTQTDCQCQGEANCQWCKIRNILEAGKL